MQIKKILAMCVVAAVMQSYVAPVNATVSEERGGRLSEMKIEVTPQQISNVMKAFNGNEVVRSVFSKKNDNAILALSKVVVPYTILTMQNKNIPLERLTKEIAKQMNLGFLNTFNFEDDKSGFSADLKEASKGISSVTGKNPVDVVSQFIPVMKKVLLDEHMDDEDVWWVNDSGEDAGLDIKAFFGSGDKCIPLSNVVYLHKILMRLLETNESIQELRAEEKGKGKEEKFIRDLERVVGFFALWLSESNKLPSDWAKNNFSKLDFRFLRDGTWKDTIMSNFLLKADGIEAGKVDIVRDVWMPLKDEFSRDDLKIEDEPFVRAMSQLKAIVKQCPPEKIEEKVKEFKEYVAKEEGEEKITELKREKAEAEEERDKTIADLQSQEDLARTARDEKIAELEREEAKLESECEKYETVKKLTKEEAEARSKLEEKIAELNNQEDVTWVRCNEKIVDLWRQTVEIESKYSEEYGEIAELKDRIEKIKARPIKEHGGIAELDRQIAEIEPKYREEIAKSHSETDEANARSRYEEEIEKLESQEDLPEAERDKKIKELDSEKAEAEAKAKLQSEIDEEKEKEESA